MSAVTFEKISEDESWEIFDHTSQRLLGIRGDEFARRWDSGDYAGSDDIDVMQVAMLRPGGR
jgi:hypothetical protein